MPRGAEGSDSYGRILRSRVQEHLQSGLAETTESRNQKSRTDILPPYLSPRKEKCLHLNRPSKLQFANLLFTLKTRGIPHHASDV